MFGILKAIRKWWHKLTSNNSKDYAQEYYEAMEGVDSASIGNDTKQ